VLPLGQIESAELFDPLGKQAGHLARLDHGHHLGDIERKKRAQLLARRHYLIHFHRLGGASGREGQPDRTALQVTRSLRAMRFRGFDRGLEQLAFDGQQRQTVARLLPGSKCRHIGVLGRLESGQGNGGALVEFLLALILRPGQLALALLQLGYLLQVGFGLLVLAQLRALGFQLPIQSFQHQLIVRRVDAYQHRTGRQQFARLEPRMHFHRRASHFGNRRPRLFRTRSAEGFDGQPVRGALGPKRTHQPAGLAGWLLRRNRPGEDQQHTRHHTHGHQCCRGQKVRPASRSVLLVHERISVERARPISVCPIVLHLRPDRCSNCCTGAHIAAPVPTLVFTNHAG